MSVRPKSRLVNAPNARFDQAVCQGLLIRLPDAAIGVPLPRAAAQAAHGALHGLCCARLSACGRSPWCAVRRQPECAPVALTWPARAATDSTIDRQPTPPRDPAHVSSARPPGSEPQTRMSLFRHQNRNVNSERLRRGGSKWPQEDRPGTCCGVGRCRAVAGIRWSAGSDFVGAFAEGAQIESSPAAEWAPRSGHLGEIGLRPVLHRDFGVAAALMVRKYDG